ncbi:hypothetical protein [Roseiflexus sp.]|uniref:hypothetical protein n=1 Tax=Roseiflexus sp. TaxID=2562120 RepID=UPI0021DE8360|nr:hypothetical protein [Roseiflexus sp.]GIW02625.1 MAG: hypothetical protein KatS3mg058_4028 [Roseiflexus sp.]
MAHIAHKRLRDCLLWLPGVESVRLRAAPEQFFKHRFILLTVSGLLCAIYRRRVLAASRQHRAKQIIKKVAPGFRSTRVSLALSGVLWEVCVH